MSDLKCGKPPPIRMWFSACVAPYQHGGDCQFDPLPALTETEGICETCGNDLVAWDRLRAENVDLADRLGIERVYSQHLKSLLAEALPWWEEEGNVDPECADLVARITDAIR